MAIDVRAASNGNLHRLPRPAMVALDPVRLAAAKYAYTTRFVAAEVAREPRGYFLDTDRSVRPHPGDVVMAEVMWIGQHKRLESPASRRATMYAGDEIVVAYGNRYAPDQFEAEVPEDLSENNLVAAGGVVGHALSAKEGLEEPTVVQPLGLLHDAEGVATLAAFAPYAPLAPVDPTPPRLRAERPAVVAVVGTSMNSGKSTAMACLTHGLTAAGMRVAAGKATGTGAGGDPGTFVDAGAIAVLDFTDFGQVSTYRLKHDTAGGARGALRPRPCGGRHAGPRRAGGRDLHAALSQEHAVILLPSRLDSAREEARALPRLLTGSRRWSFSGLVLAGLAQAAAAAATVLTLTRGLHAGTRTAEVVTVVVLVIIAGIVGWTRSRERLLSERLGQDYAHEIRLCLIRHLLDGHRRSSLGTTMTRASNDLTSVRNWVALGIGPIAVGIPLVLGCTLVLGALEPMLALAVLVPLLALTAVLWLGSRAAYERSRRVRKERGRLAGHLADTLTATMAIRSAGGEYRELKRLDHRSASMVQASIDRARVLGRIRGATTAATGLATARVIATSMLAGLSGAHLAAALTVVGLMASPVQDLGRVVEYRQTFRAARAVLAPALTPPTSGPAQVPVTDSAMHPAGTGPDEWVRQHEPSAAFDEQVGLVVHGLRLAEAPDVQVPPLFARPGDRVVVRSEDRAWASSVLAAVVGLERPLAGQVRVTGKDLATTPFREHRTLLGYAAQGMRLERTTIARAVRYRHPDAAAESVGDTLARVGLAERVASLPGGEKALLRQGGDPLTLPDRARLLLARAVFGQPPLLVLDHIDAELGRAGRAEMREVLRDYPGVVLLAADTPDEVMTPNRRWDLDRGGKGS